MYYWGIRTIVDFLPILCVGDVAYGPTYCKAEVTQPGKRKECKTRTGMVSARRYVLSISSQTSTVFLAMELSKMHRSEIVACEIIVVDILHNVYGIYPTVYILDERKSNWSAEKAISTNYPFDLQPSRPDDYLARTYLQFAECTFISQRLRNTLF